MKQIVLEFSRPLQVSRISKGGSHEVLKADAEECARLAKRLEVPALHALSARLLAKPWRGGGVRLSGQLTADIEQVSVISLEAFRHTVTLELERFFLPEPPDEDDLEAGVIDPIVGGIIDLGEVVAETLALELDPYPRKPGEQFTPGEEPAVSEPTIEKVKPFAGLANLKRSADE